jgi:tetratricopeptide (TPR) repeat protein
MRRLAGILVVLAVLGPVAAFAQEPANPAPVSKRERERRAESAFVAGRYQEAAELLNGLYVEFHNPVYLRNLGRCHQRLKDPDRAIAAFEEYLRRGKGITAAERDEVSGFIRDMEELKRQQAAAPVPPPPPPSPAPAPPVLTAPPPAAVVVAPPPVQTVEAKPAARSSGPGKLVGGILLGAGALLAAGGGAMLASSWSEFHRGERLGCGSYDCKMIADRVQARALVAKILFGAGAAVGIAGGTVLVLGLSGGNERADTGLSVAVAGRF